MEKINIKYLAKELKMSASTVSRALHDSYEISETTKKKVLELARRLDYQPDSNASGLREKRTYRIALVIPEVANNFFSFVIDGIESIASDRKYHVQIYLTHESQEKELAFIKQLANGRADGIIISVAGSETKTHLAPIISNKVPLVFFDRVPDDTDQPSVSTDDYESSFKATEHLISQGCKKIGCLVVPDNVSISSKRRGGYLDAVKKYGLKSFCVECSNDIDSYAIEIRKFLEEVKPDGLFTSVEKLAVSAYYSCREMGFQIPKDVKLVSFSNLPTAALLNPSLTTVTQPAFQIGREAASMLFNLINGKPVHEKSIVVKSELIIRESTQKII